jgi:hypothetical protein
MKLSLGAVMAACVACALPAAAFANQMISGVIPPGRTPVLLHVSLPVAPTLLRFTFTAPNPTTNPHVRYDLSFCVGVRTNPCGLPTSKVVVVPEGVTKVADFNSSIFKTNVLVVGQGTKFPIPYKVAISP